MEHGNLKIAGSKHDFFLLSGEAVLQFLNQNWKQVTEEFGQPLVDKLVDIVYTIVKRFFEAIPKDELFVQ